MLNRVVQTKSECKPWEAVPDAEIWDSFKSGSSEALEHIYRTYAKDLFNFGMKIKANSSLVEDAIQELFVELWSSPKKSGQYPENQILSSEGLEAEDILSAQ